MTLFYSTSLGNRTAGGELRSVSSTMKSPIPASRSSPGTGGSKSNPDAAKRIICDKLVQLGQNLRNPKAGQCIAVIHRQCEVLSHTMQNTTHVQSLWSDLRGYVRIGQLERAAQLADVILLSWRHLDPVVLL